ncbi:hypothetical protein BOSEA1005_40014 [Hyphomicrobiales bacterium]|nr:hypothetical protein BOSEA1005_40014 [Hyphomicrobiales bacterium]
MSNNNVSTLLFYVEIFYRLDVGEGRMLSLTNLSLCPQDKAVIHHRSNINFFCDKIARIQVVHDPLHFLDFTWK